MKFFIFKYFFVFLFISYTFCTPGGPLLQFSTSYPGLPALRVYSLVEPLAEGTTCVYTGIYDYQPAGNRNLPVIRVFDPEKGTGFAYLNDTLAVPYGTCIKINGIVIKEFLRIKPLNEIPVKKIHVNEMIIETEPGVFIQKADKLYEKYLQSMQKYNTKHKIDLKLPPNINWRLLFDEKKNYIIVYMVTGNVIYESRMECVFDKKSKEVNSLYFNSYLKGE